MKKTLLLLAFAFFGTLRAQTYPTPTFETYISVDTAVVPDKITMELRLSELDLRSREELQEKEAEMIAALSALGIDISSQLTVTDIGSNLKEVLFGKDEVIKRKKYALVVANAQTAGDVIIAMEQASIANVRITTTEITATEDLELALIEKAMRKAFKQLKAANRLTNMEYDKVRQIRIDQNRNTYLRNKVGAMRTEVLADHVEAEEIQWSSQEVSFEKQEVTLKVAVILELRPIK